MKKLIKPMLLCMLFGLILLVPDNIAAKTKTNTSTYYYMYANSHALYKNQTVLVVMENVPYDHDRNIVEIQTMKKVKKIIFSDSVSSIPLTLLSKCPNVEELDLRNSSVIPGTGEEEIGSLKHLKTIKVSSGNSSYKVKDNILYNKNMTTILAYPYNRKNTTYNMPSTVTTGIRNISMNPYLQKIQLSKAYASDRWYNMPKSCFPKLQSIIVAEGNQNYKAKGGVLYTFNMKTICLYPNGKKDTEYTVPSTVTALDSCFGPNKYMKTIVLGKNVKSFDDDSDKNAVNLPNLTRIKVSSSNKYFSAFNGTLFTKDYRELLYCAKGKVKPYQIKAGTVAVGEYAFYYCKVKSITFPEGVVRVKGWPFHGSAVQEIMLPASIQDIRSDMCYSANALKSISVRKGCKDYYSKNGILYAKDGTIMISPNNLHQKKVTLVADSTGTVSLRGNIDKYTETLVIGKNVKTITGTFGVFNKIKKLELNSENTNFHLYNGVLYNADYSKIVLYPNYNTDKTVTLHKDLKELNQDWFSGNNNTVELTLPAGLEKIVTRYTSASSNATCEAGKEQEYVEFEEIGTDDADSINSRDVAVSFKRSLFPNLKKIYISSQNTHFVSIDNVLYTKNMNELVWYPVSRTNTEYTLPSTVTKLNGQLRESRYLKKLNLSGNVNSTLDFIGAYSNTLETITVPKSSTNYTTVSGVLYNKTKTKLIVYPNGKKSTSYTMPNTVTYARFNFTNTHLQTITLSNKLETVIRYPEIFTVSFEDKYSGTGVFGGFTKLKKVNGIRDNIKFCYNY